MQVIDSHTDSIYRVIGSCIDKKINFAAYRLPGKPELTLVVQKDPEIHEVNDITGKLPEKGFLIAPFLRNSSDKTCLIHPDIVVRDCPSPQQLKEIRDLPALEPVGPNSTIPGDTSRNEYIDLIGNTIEKIREGIFEKVVLSRIKSVQGDYTSRLADIFDTLCETYPGAFVYLFCLKGHCWTGASPEPFLCAKNGELTAVSMAGTRTYSAENSHVGNWNAKELQEQEYVTRHIEKVLLAQSITGFRKNGPYAAKAGNLIHLRTDFSFPVYDEGKNLPRLIGALHPTPAVCGMSTGKALDFIRNAEKHNREYYTGLLGPVGLDDLMQLYVNLRCMKVLDDRLILYIGGGITLDSVAEEEWEETEIKADTLLSVLHQLE